MTTHQDANSYVWSDVRDAPADELFPGIRLRPLWRGDNGATAHVRAGDGPERALGGG